MAGPEESALLWRPEMGGVEFVERPPTPEVERRMYEKEGYKFAGGLALAPEFQPDPEHQDEAPLLAA